MSRIDQLKEMLLAEPRDVFLRYALAMEYRGQQQYEPSLAGFRELMAETPPHVSSFFMCGQLLAEMDRVNEAREVLRNGIEQARQQGDFHAAGEMSDFLADLGSLGE